MKKDTLKTENRDAERRSGFSSFCSAAGIILIIIVIAAMIPLFVPRILGYQVYDITSGSMEPEMPVWSMVLVKDAEPSDISTGDVIAYSAGDIVVTHRVMKNDADERSFITKGDANEMMDMSPVSYSQLIGKVTAHFPVIGGIMAALTDIKGKVFLFALLAGGVILQAVGRRKSKESSSK